MEDLILKDGDVKITFGQWDSESELPIDVYDEGLDSDPIFIFLSFEQVEKLRDYFNEQLLNYEKE